LTKKDKNRRFTQPEVEPFEYVQVPIAALARMTWFVIRRRSLNLEAQIDRVVKRIARFRVERHIHFLAIGANGKFSPFSPLKVAQ
jgi:hypothetical protein